MIGRLFILGVVTATLAVASADLSACGDKFLRIGRSARFNGYAAVHPASILLFVPQSAKPSAVKDFESALTRAGHKFHAVTTMDAFSAALAGGKVDIVIAAVGEVAKLRPHAIAAASKPEILPIVHKPTKVARVLIEREYRHALELPAARHEALAEIDHVMELRRKSVQVNGAN